MTRFVKGLAPLLVALLVAGCEHAVGGESPYQGHSYIVGIDISGSRTKTDLDESRKLLDDLIDRLQAGDRRTLIEGSQGGREPARQWSDSVRTPRDGGVRVARGLGNSAIIVWRRRAGMCPGIIAGN